MRYVLLFFCFLLSSSYAVDVSELSNFEIIGYDAGVRPCRRGGIRVAAENDQGKLIIHNYGHGGCGISLSWGSVRLALRLLEKQLKNHPEYASKKIAVLGSGVIGLTTAHVLRDQGYQVQLYARDFPPNTTSNLAPAIWSKFLVSVQSSQEEIKLLQKIEKLSFADFRVLAEADNPRFHGVAYMDAYTFKGMENVKSKLPRKLAHTCELVDVQFKNDKKNVSVIAVLS